MAYGQTGTGKTFTLGMLGEEDTSDRGIMVRSMEDVLANISPESDSVTVSYLQVFGVYPISVKFSFIAIFQSIVCFRFAVVL